MKFSFIYGICICLITLNIGIQLILFGLNPNFNIFLYIILMYMATMHALSILKSKNTNSFFSGTIGILYFLLAQLSLLSVGSVIGFEVSIPKELYDSIYPVFTFCYAIPFFILFFLLYICMAISFLKNVPFGLFEISKKRISLTIGCLILLFVLFGSYTWYSEQKAGRLAYHRFFEVIQKEWIKSLNR